MIKQDSDATIKEVIATITEIAPRIPRTMTGIGGNVHESGKQPRPKGRSF